MTEQNPAAEERLMTFSQFVSEISKLPAVPAAANGGELKEKGPPPSSEPPPDAVAQAAAELVLKQKIAAAIENDLTDFELGRLELQRRNVEVRATETGALEIKNGDAWVPWSRTVLAELGVSPVLVRPVGVPGSGSRALPDVRGGAPSLPLSERMKDPAFARTNPKEFRRALAQHFGWDRER